MKITDAQNAARTQTLTYNFLDALLTEKTGSGRNDTFGYDLNHNRLGVTKDSTGTNGYSYGYTGSQLTSVTHNTTYATNSLAYDATGSLTQDSSRTFNYDARGRMTSMTKNNKTTQYRYNGLGQRFGKGGVIYMYDLAGHLIGEYTNTGALIQETVWLNDLPIATIRPNGAGIAVYFVHADELGTPRVVTDTAQKPVWRWDGDAFGRGLPNQDPLKTGKSFVYHLRYPGQYYDTESGLHYNYFRDYDPETGRYIQSDPIGLAGGFNTYAYVGGNPIIFADEYGLCPAGTHLASDEEARKILDAAKNYTGKNIPHKSMQCNQLVDRSINDAFPGAVKGEPNTTAIRNGEGPFEPLDSPTVGGLALLNKPGHVVFVTKTNNASVSQFLGSQSLSGPAYVNLPTPYWSKAFNEAGNVKYFGVCLPN